MGLIDGSSVEYGEEGEEELDEGEEDGQKRQKHTEWFSSTSDKKKEK